MSTEYLYESGYDMIDAAADEHIETEEDIFFDAHEDDVNNAVIDSLISPEEEEKARAAIAIEDSYEDSEELDDEPEDDE